MHTGGSYGPWYRRWYIPYALETGAPLWVPSAEAHEIVGRLREEAWRADGLHVLLHKSLRARLERST